MLLLGLEIYMFGEVFAFSMNFVCELFGVLRFACCLVVCSEVWNDRTRTQKEHQNWKNEALN